jgi:DNA (cytosine-5)-methyltransferase 1
MGKPIIIDLFSGAGGESSGITDALNVNGMDCEMYAVNHWDLALETHGMNHPEAKHYCEDVFKGTAKRHIKGRRVALLWASPECTHFSVAKGGGPCNPQSRAGANSVLEWCRDLCIDRVILENVSEWTSWGPLDSSGHAIKSQKGKFFKKWLKDMDSLGYDVEYRKLIAADYGAPTSRERLFVQAVLRSTGKKIIWPKQQYTKEQWIPASSVIDWSDLGTPLHLRNKPLCERTMIRIEKGIMKHWGEYANPYLVILRGTSTTRSIDRPLPTITAGGQHLGLICPIDNGSNLGGSRHVNEPLSTIVTKQRHGLVTPMVMGQHSCSMARNACREPIPTITTVPHVKLITPLIDSHYGNGQSRPTSLPVPTVTTKERFGLVTPLPMAIGYRMLSATELALGQSFPAEYKFAGNKTQTVKQIGNAVPPKFALAQVLPYIQEWKDSL